MKELIGWSEKRALPDLPNDFDNSGGGEQMARPAYGGRTTCESCIRIDVRRWHRGGGCTLANTSPAPGLTGALGQVEVAACRR
jgi:hypothetical protein